MDVLLFFKALADETRLRVINLLRERELNVNEIVAILEMGQSRISRHLKILSDAGILFPRREGLWVFYSLTDPAQKFFRENMELMEGVPFFLEDRERIRVVMDKKVQEHAHFFNSLAGSWNKMKTEIFNGFDPDILVVDSIDSTSVIADLGCGTGELLRKLKEKGTHLIGVDSSPRMLEQAKTNNSEETVLMDFRLGNIEHLPLKDKEADFVIFNMVLHHFGDINPALKESFRVLKDKGELIITEFYKHDLEEMRSRYGDYRLGFDPGELEQTFSAAGFYKKDSKILPLNRGLKILFYHYSK